MKTAIIIWTLVALALLLGFIFRYSIVGGVDREVSCEDLSYMQDAPIARCR